MSERLCNDIKIFEELVESHFGDPSTAMRLWYSIKSELKIHCNDLTHEEEICLALAKGYNE